jgi:hypothetical protein
VFNFPTKEQARATCEAKVGVQADELIEELKTIFTPHHEEDEPDTYTIVVRHDDYCRAAVDLAAKRLEEHTEWVLECVECDYDGWMLTLSLKDAT